MEKKLGWGLLGTAQINGAVMEPLRKSRRNLLLAVASRDRERAGQYARKHKISRSYGSYDELLADPEIQVVYNALPNALHAEWTIRAVQAGKHVLCEKPLALSLREVDAIAEAARASKRVVMEGLMFRCHSQTWRVRDLVQSGEVGRVRLVRGAFTYSGIQPGNYRLDARMGGGCLWDVGCYPLGFTRFILGCEPQEVFGWQEIGASGVDETFAGQIRFPQGEVLQMHCSMVMPYHVFMEIIGEQATLVVPQPFSPGARENFFLARKGNTKTIQTISQGAYAGEVEAMADAILEDKPPVVGLEESRAGTAAILGLFESARRGQPVRLDDGPAQPPPVPGRE